MKRTSLPLLRTLSTELRLLAGLAMLTLAVGYIHATAYVYLTTRMVPKGIEERFRGTEPPTTNHTTAADSSNANSEIAELQDSATVQTPPKSVTGEMQYQKSLAEMLNLIHTHVISMTLIFALSGLITLATSTLRPALRKFVVVEPFVGILLTFLGIWGTRFLHPAFSWLANISGALMAIAFFIQCYAVAMELIASRTTSYEA